MCSKYNFIEVEVQEADKPSNDEEVSGSVGKEFI